MDAAHINRLRESVEVPDPTTFVQDRWDFSGPIAGLTLFLLWFAATDSPLAARVLLLSILVLVPLGLRLADQPKNGPITPATSWLRLLSPLAGATAWLSMTIDPGFFSSIFALPWLGFTFAVSIVGLLRFLSRSGTDEPAIGVDFAMIMLGLAGFWFFIHRTGLTPLGGTAGDNALATTHLHVLGFGLPLVTGIISRRTGRGSPLATIVSVATVIAGFGLFVGGRPALVGSILACVLGLVVANQILTTGSAESGLPKALFTASGGVLVVSVLCQIGLLALDDFELATVNVVADFSRLATAQRLMEIGAIAGTAGFALLAVVGLNLRDEGVSAEDSETVIHLGPRTNQELHDLLRYSETQPNCTEPDLLDSPTLSGYHRGEWSVPVPDFDNSCDALFGWAGHDAAGIKIKPEIPKIVIGETFAMSVPVGPFTVTASARITDIVNEADHYGFSYTTLVHHVWEAHESLVVSVVDERPMITATSVWKPTVLASSLCLPLTRSFQNRVVGRCLQGIADAEAALIGEYMSEVVGGVKKRQLPISRDALVQTLASDRLVTAEATTAQEKSEQLPDAPAETPTPPPSLEDFVAADPESINYDDLFSQPFDDSTA